MIAPTLGTAPVTRSSGPRRRRASLVTARARGGQQHEPGDPRQRDVGVPDGERLDRHPAHRVTHEDGAAQIEGFEHAAHVVREVVDRMAGVAHGGLAVAAAVEREGAEPRGGNRVELLRPGARRQRDAVREQDRRADASRDDVEAAGVVAVDPDRFVERGDQRVVGVGIVAVPEAGRQETLARVDDAADAGGDAGRDPRALERVAEVHGPGCRAGAHVVAAR